MRCIFHRKTFRRVVDQPPVRTFQDNQPIDALQPVDQGQALLHAQHQHGRAQPVGEGAVVGEDGHARDAVADRVPGGGVDVVGVTDAVLHEELAVVAAGGKGLVFQGDDLVDVVGPRAGSGPTDTHPPGTAVRTSSRRVDLATDLDQEVREAGGAQHLDQLVHAVALADGGQVEGHRGVAFDQCAGVPDFDFVETDILEKSGNRCERRHAARACPPAEPPHVHQRPDGPVPGPARKLVQPGCRLHHPQEVRRNREFRADLLKPVEAADLAVLEIRRDAAVDFSKPPIDFFLKPGNGPEIAGDHRDAVGRPHRTAGERVLAALVAAEQRGEKRQPDKATRSAQRATRGKKTRRTGWVCLRARMAAVITAAVRQSMLLFFLLLVTHSSLPVPRYSLLVTRHSYLSRCAAVAPPPACPRCGCRRCGSA